MKEEFPDSYWVASARADFVTQEAIDELKTGNCIGITWGFESGSQTMLDLMNKRMTIEKNLNALSLAQKAGLVNDFSEFPLSFVLGHPGETNKTIKETLATIKKGKLSRGAVFYATPYPGGRVWDWTVERGIIEDTHEYLMRVSGRNAYDFNINLTPYPDFIVKGWMKIVEHALHRNDGTWWKKLSDIPLSHPDSKNPLRRR